MAKHLFEYFGCQNKEELYHRVKSKDSSVQELLDFYDFSKSAQFLNSRQITGQKSMIDFLDSTNLFPLPSEAVFVALNSQLYPVFTKTIRPDSSIDELFASLSQANYNSYIFVENIQDGSNQSTQAILGHLDKYLELLENTKIDHLLVENDILSNGIRVSSIEHFSSEDFKLQHNFSAPRTIDRTFTFDNPIYEGPEFQLDELEGYSDFTSYYVESEILGRHIKDVDTQELLKLNYQDKEQEHLLLMTYDSDYKINQIHDLFVGGLSRSLAEPRNVASIISQKEVSGFILAHNHPSGHNAPSKNDIKATKGFVELGNMLHKPLFDHYIIAREGVRSLSGDYNLDKLKHSQQNILMQVLEQEKDRQEGVAEDAAAYQRMSQKQYKKMKAEVTADTAVGVGFFEGIESKIPLYATAEATRTIALNGWIKDSTSDAELANMLVTEAIKAMNYQDFKEVAPYLFTYPREQREQDRLVRPVEVSRDFFNQLQADADELFQIKRSQKESSLSTKIRELETDEVPNGDRVLGVDMEKGELLLMRTAENAYIDDWEIRRPGLITDYRSKDEDSLQALRAVSEGSPYLKALFRSYVLNKDTVDGFVDVDKEVLKEVSPLSVPNFTTHQEFFNYASNFMSFRNEYENLADYINKTYELHYPTDYGVQWHCEAILTKQLEQINKELAKEEKELVVVQVENEQSAGYHNLSYLRDMRTETKQEVEDYLFSVVGSYYQNDLTELVVIDLSSIDPELGYNGAVKEKYFVSEYLLTNNSVLDSLEVAQLRFPHLSNFYPPEEVKEEVRQKDRVPKEKGEELEL
ncbi:TPA: hypothetical protein UD640_001416 [Streptococcus suis]|nr:hypothetical protein [Streptococcus suis]